MVAYTEGVGSLFLPIAATVTVFHSTVPTLDPQKKTPDPFGRQFVLEIPHVTMGGPLRSHIENVNGEPLDGGGGGNRDATLGTLATLLLTLSAAERAKFAALLVAGDGGTPRGRG